MNDSSNAIEIAKNKIKSLEKNKDVRTLVQVINEALLEMSQSFKKDEKFNSERDVYVDYVLRCLSKFVSDRKPNREVLVEAFNLDNKKKGRPKKKEDGWDYSHKELKLFFQVGITYEELEGKKSLDRAYSEVSKRSHVGYESLRKTFRSFGGLKEWRNKFKDEFYAPVLYKHQINELVHLKKRNLLKSEKFINATKQRQEQLIKKLEMEDEQLVEILKDQDNKPNRKKPSYLSIKNKIIDLKKTR